MYITRNISETCVLSLRLYYFLKTNMKNRIHFPLLRIQKTKRNFKFFFLSLQIQMGCHPVVPVFKMRYSFPGTKPGSVRLEKSPSKNDLIRLFVIQEFGNREFKFRPLEILQLEFFLTEKMSRNHAAMHRRL